MSLILAMTLVAGVIDELDPAEVHSIHCRDRAEIAARDGADAIINVWEDCVEEARAQGASDLATRMAGELMVARLDRDYARLKSEQPAAFSRILLASAAQNPLVSVSPTVLNDHLHVLQGDADARNSLESVSSAGVRWLPDGNLSDNHMAFFDDTLRRRVADLGLRVPPGDSQHASDARIMILVRGVTTALPRAVDDERGRLHAASASIESQSIRFKARGSRATSIQVETQATDTSLEGAHQQAMESTAQAFADELLIRLVQEVFGDYRVPAP